MCKECSSVITLRERRSVTARRTTETQSGSLGVCLEGNYIFSTADSPAIQTEMTTELEQAAASCCLLQQRGLDHTFLS